MGLLGERGIFPMDAFVQVDPDQLRRELPEMQGYVQRNPETAGSLTHKEVRIQCVGAGAGGGTGTGTETGTGAGSGGCYSGSDGCHSLESQGV